MRKLCVCVPRGASVFELHVPVRCSEFTYLISANISLHVVPLTNHTFAEWLP